MKKSGIHSIRYLIRGMLFVDCIGQYFSLAILAILLSTLVWMLETLYYLIVKDARKILQLLSSMKNFNAHLTLLTASVRWQLPEPGTMKDIFTIKCNLKAFLIRLGLRSLQQFSGIPAFESHMHTMFSEASEYIPANISVFIYLIER